MLFAIDVGNTHIVLGCLDGDKIVYTARMSTDRVKTENEYAVSISEILRFSGIELKSFDGAIISSVVPQVTEPLRLAVKMLMQLEPVIVGTGIKTGLNIQIDNPAQLGSDLVVGAVAALSEYEAPLILLDMGTATTISVIGHNSAFLGGAIMPGVALSLNALASGTSQLPSVSIDAPRKVIGRNTIDCMKSGSVFGTAAMIDGMIDRIEEELGEKTTIIATGGLAGRIIPNCRHDIIYDDEMLLRGLSLLYQKNKK